MILKILLPYINEYNFIFDGSNLKTPLQFFTLKRFGYLLRQTNALKSLKLKFRDFPVSSQITKISRLTSIILF